MAFSLQQIADHIGAEIRGDVSTEITGLATLTEAKPGELSFLDNKQYLKSLPSTQASAVIIAEEFADKSPTTCLISQQPYVAFARATALFSQQPKIKQGIHPTAVIGENCQLPDSVTIGAYAVIADNVSLGENTVIAEHCSIAEGCQIGANCHIYPGSAIYYNCIIGDDVTMQAGVIIGAEGFGFANNNGKWVHIRQLGRVVIGNRVEIGANTCIDRGAIKDTIIADDVIIDNQVQIGHNVEIGTGTAIAGCTGIAGSSKIGRYCLIGGSVDINGHIEICDKVSLVGSTTVMRSITKPGVYSSATTEQSYQDWLRSLAIFHRLPKMAKTLKNIQALADRYQLSEDKPSNFKQRVLAFFLKNKR